MKKIFLSFVFLAFICGASFADVVYTAATGASAGIGLIKVTSSKDISAGGLQYSQLSGGAVVAPYWENNTSNGNGKSKLIVVTPVDSTSTALSGDQAYTFDPSNLASPENTTAIVLKGTYGKPIIASTATGAYIYLASNSAIREYATANFNLRNVCTLTSSDALPNPEVKGLIVDNRVHALVQRPAGSGDVVINFDGQLKYSESTMYATKTGANAIAFLSSGTGIAHNKGVQIISGSTSSDVVTTTDPVIAICKDTGSGFYYVEKGSSNFSLKHYKNADTTATIFSDVAVDTNSVQLLDAGYNLLAIAIGGSIRFYDMANNDALVNAFSAGSLGGSAISIAPATTSGNNGSSGGSGCVAFRSEELGVRSLLMLAALGLMLKKARKL